LIQQTEHIQTTELFGSSTASAFFNNFDEEIGFPNISIDIDFLKNIEFTKNWEEIKDFPSIDPDDYDKFQTLVSFTTKLLDNMEPLESEVAEIISDHFWDFL